MIVVDPAGQPVSGAAVSPVSLSINGFAKLTNAMGEADVQYNVSIQETKWIQISKEGYVTQQVDRPEKWPLRVVLHPSDVVKGGEP